MAEGVATAARLTARRVASDPHLAGAIAVLRERVDLLDRRGQTIGDRGVTHASATVSYTHLTLPTILLV